MKYSVSTTAIERISTDCLVIPVWSTSPFGETVTILDKSCNRTISKMLADGELKGQAGTTLMLRNLSGIRAKRVLLAACGDKKKFTAKTCSRVLAAVFGSIKSLPIESVTLQLGELQGKTIAGSWLISRIAQDAETSLYQFNQTKSKKKPKSKLKTVTISLPQGVTRKAANSAIALGKALGEGINTARDLGNLPGNICTPSYLADYCKKLGTRFAGMKTNVLSEKQMQRMGMGSLLSVSAGSAEEAKLIVMHYQGSSRANSKPHVIVGKGITFDTGGISLKPGGAMDEMKFDMCGAASVVGTMQAIASIKLPLNVIGIIPSAENMPSGRATKPGDIVTSMAGKTIEILNTDAEGRLVLCDALTYAERFKPRSVIDIATLTGAAVATFGNVVTALLSNNQELADELLSCGSNCLDPAWQLPLWDEYQMTLDSNFADIANIGGPRAGTITAACFLSRFTEKLRWAHLDIAGSAWNSGKDKGATGRPVSLLVEYLRQQKA